MTNENDKGAVIYCRVSTAKQVKHGDGLASQETRCREFAQYRGYPVVEVFRDDMSGSMIDRPGMKAMLAYLHKHRGRPHAVIIDDISRLARGLDAHLQLRSAIASVGAMLESPSIEFGEDPDSILVENLLASVSQHQRQKNGEQVKNRMRARVANGYWVFQAPVGYRYERLSGHGKVLVRNEPLASIVQEALEGYASGRFQTQGEVKRFLEAQPDFPSKTNGYARYQRISDLLSSPVYAGYVFARKWDVPLRKGHHTPLISFETFKKIEARMAAKPVAPVRATMNSDFPLRGAIACGHCGYALTACWSTGRSAHYPYYLCTRQGCAAKGKSIRKEVLERDFEALLRSVLPTPGLLTLASKMFRELWEHRATSEAERARNLKTELAKVNQQIGRLLDRIATSDIASVTRAYETRIRNLEEQKLLIGEKMAKCGRPVRHYDEILRTALDFLGNPWKLWASDRMEDKRMVLKLVFVERLSYIRDSGFRTAHLSLPFKVLGGLSDGDLKMVRREGLEPSSLAALEPKSSVSANSTTGARRQA